MFCKRCGSKISENSKFCPGCGLEIKKENSILSGWKNLEEVKIPSTKREAQDVVIRKYIAPKVRLENLSIEYEDKKEYLLDIEEEHFEEDYFETACFDDECFEDDATVILSEFKIINMKVIRLKTGEEKEITGDTFTIGKSRECDFVINENPTISRRHAEIIKREDGYWLKDLGSVNHTYVEGWKVCEPVKVTREMIFKLSDEEFLIA